MRALLPLRASLISTALLGTALSVYWLIAGVPGVVSTSYYNEGSFLILLAVLGGILAEFFQGRGVGATGLHLEGQDASSQKDKPPGSDHLDRHFDAIPTLIWSAKPDGSGEYFNRRWLEYTGLNEEMAGGWGWLDAIHPEDKDGLVDRWQTLLASGMPGEAEARIRRYDGEYRWFLLRGEPVLSDDGVPIRWFGTNTDIDDLKMTEHRLRLAEKKFRTIVDNIPALVVCAFSDGTVDFANARWAEEGFLESEVIGGPASHLHPDDLPDFMRHYRPAVDAGLSYEAEARLRKANGEYRWHLIRSVAAKDENGGVFRRYATVTDIDGRKRAEQQLRHAEATFRTILNVIPALVVSSSADGIIDFINGRWVEEGFAEADVRGGAPRIVHPEDLPGFLVEREKSLPEGPYQAEVRLRKANGDYRWYLLRSVVAKDDAGRFYRRYATATDIDDRRKMEEALRARECELQRIVDAVPALIYVVSGEGVPTYVNRATEAYYGIPLEDLPEADGSKVKGSVRARVHPDDAMEVEARLMHSYATGEPFSMRYRNFRFDGALRWVEGRVKPLRDDQGNVIRWYGVVWDIDDEVVAQERFRVATEKLSRASRLASLAELSASIAHEIKQPLAAVVSNSEACQRWLSVDPSDVKRITLIADRIVRDAHAVADIVGRVRALFKQDSNSRSWINVNELIEEVQQLLAGELLGSHVAFRADLDASLPPIFGDRVQLQQVVVNLVRNGIEAMQSASEHPKVIAIRTSFEESKVGVDVRDTGIGIKEPERIFEPFFTTKSEGMGMGLAICRSILSAHGGILSAKRAEPRGSVFTVALPLRMDDA